MSPCPRERATSPRRERHSEDVQLAPMLFGARATTARPFKPWLLLPPSSFRELPAALPRFTVTQGGVLPGTGTQLPSLQPWLPVHLLVSNETEGAEITPLPTVPGSGPSQNHGLARSLSHGHCSVMCFSLSPTILPLNSKSGFYFPGAVVSVVPGPGLSKHLLNGWMKNVLFLFILSYLLFSLPTFQVN